MSGGAPLPATPATQRILLRAARAMDDPWGRTLEISILTLCLPWETLAIRLDRIDWDSETVPVPARGGAKRIVALSRPAQQAILRIAGDAGGSGQVVTAGRGSPVENRLFRMDRLLDRLAAACPKTIALPEWNMHGLRLGATEALVAAGADKAEIAALLGRSPRWNGRSLRGDAMLARVGAERWSRLLLQPG